MFIHFCRVHLKSALPLPCCDALVMDFFSVSSPARHSQTIHSWWRGLSANAPEHGHSAASAHCKPCVTRTEALTLQTFCAFYLYCREAQRLIWMCKKPSRCFCFSRPDAHRRQGKWLSVASLYQIIANGVQTWSSAFLWILIAGGGDVEAGRELEQNIQ